MLSFKNILVFVAFLFVMPTFGLGRRGDMIGSGGFGFTMSPTLVLLTPQLEYVYKDELMFGGLAQMAFGDATIVTTSGSVRWTIPYHPHVHPTFEGALGMTIGAGTVASSVGVHIMLGAGAEYILNKDTTVGTMLRLNFAPPLDGFFLSWPLIVGRFRL